MPTIRFYFDAFFDIEIEELENKLESNSINVRGKSDHLISGFYKKNRIFKNVLGYDIGNFLEIGKKVLPSMNSELAYFNLIERNMNTDKKFYPILIKLIINKEEGILCFYSRQIIQNKTANKLVIKLHKDYGFNFKFSLVNNHFVFRKNELDTFLAGLDVNDYTAISVFDNDKTLIIKNNKCLTKTDKVISFLEELKTGNWSYVRLVNENLNFEIRLSNNKTQNYLTFENGYINDVHLVKAVDYLKKRIRDSEMYSVLIRRKQTNIDYFQQIA
jgi:hypothetical protein